MGDFTVSLGIAYRTGAARGDYSVLSAMDIQAAELFASFGRTINELILSHRDDLEKRREATCVERNLDRRWLEGSSRASGPKERWVDGTPEYSFHICGLRKLFPEARFVHVFRDVRDVVRSMVNFHRVAGVKLVANEEDAYRYWLRTVSACLLAERAYGATIVHHIRYADLISEPESTIRSLLAFLGEPYSPRCLEPLELRINSSTVPADFETDSRATSAAIVEQATQLCAEVGNRVPPLESSPAAADEIEAVFQQRVNCMAGTLHPVGKP
jgi:Sulfotransferase family